MDQASAAEAHFLATARAFDFASAALPEYVRYVGPLLRDPVWTAPWNSPWQADDERPLVLVAFSTSFQDHAGCLQRIIDACANSPVRLLVTLGGAIRHDELHPAANAALIDSAPHTLVMRDAALVITHGGHGTVMTALLNSVPLLVLPHGRDQGDNAARITERGAGLALAATAPVTDIRAAVSRLLAEPSFRTAASQLGAAIAAEIERSSLLDDLLTLAAGTPLVPQLHPEPS
jgi:UDP:flavonoid glycosyltransferase YjiC (YdhE family)